MADTTVDTYRSKALIVLMLVFLAGGISGIVSFFIFDNTILNKTNTDNSVVLSETKIIELEYLRNTLSLNPDQVQQVREILDQCIMNEADLLMQIRLNQNSGRERILKILTPEQRSKFKHELPEALSKQEASL